ncbi:MAG: carbon-nitrogen hydrolase [Deltaproteobacteria bacterium]|nr:carbon-nitrogen hydrolase [Deltaproteobacteria bacterium]
MKIGFVQLAPVLGDPDATIQKIDRLIQDKTADLLVLPELCNSGYNFRDATQAREWAEEIEHSGFIRFLEAKCSELDLHIVSGFNEMAGDHLYNTAVLVGPEGLQGKYRKIHLFMKEKDYFHPGDREPAVFDLGECKVGCLVCFDWIFPEVWRILALKGADIICHPSNLVLPGLAQSAVPIHALSNRIFVVTANRTGKEGDLAFTGLSTIADPRGNILLQASRDKEEVGVVEIDPSLSRNKWVTPRNHIFEDRRPELYRYLVNSPPDSPGAKGRLKSKGKEKEGNR